MMGRDIGGSTVSSVVLFLFPSMFFHTKNPLSQNAYIKLTIQICPMINRLSMSAEYSSSSSSDSDIDYSLTRYGLSSPSHEDHNMQGIELSPVYPGSDNVPDEILSISGEIEPRIEIETPGGSQQSSFSMANNENKQHSNPLMFEPLESFDEKAPLELPTETRLKVKIKRVKMVGEWRWVDGKDDNCGICRTTFETCCVDCKFPGDDCPLALGACTHAFHMHCIVKWTNAQNGQKPVCPLCRQEWKFAS